MRLLIIILFLIASVTSYGQVGINTDNPNPDAALDIVANNKGILIPRLTTANRIAMNDVQGMMVYDTNFNLFYFNDGTAWIQIASASTNVQAGTYILPATGTISGWQYFDVLFDTPFSTVPIISLTFREIAGRDNTGSHSIEQIKIVDAANTGFTIAIYEDNVTTDGAVDWTATPKTQ